MTDSFASPSSSGKVTAVEAQRRKGRVNVYIDHNFALSLSEVVAGRAGLRPGVTLSTADVERLSKDDAAQVALDAALNYLSHRQRSERELRLKLTRKGLASDLIDGVVLRLKEMSLLDDAEFARFWVESRDRYSPRGALALRAELFLKGVSRDFVENAILDGSDEDSRAMASAKHKLKRLGDLDAPTVQRRLMEALLRRGFSYEVSRRTVRTLTNELYSADES